ncbi:hypothetical protein [Pseudoalteromonas luteoviolacea]|uniref:hypothetical protein n=1 Tax=Pseudoalteromonas luteoviolacea TaxID=43657 RepID=UPI001154A4F0|nr:hypothetical protein [Pseudoalteromonas luteoviolacea]TQF70014.1 hypothetical protein FLM44_02660 [Pseudoalteromonas luteoviolacea]
MKYYEALEKLSKENPIIIENLISTDDLEKWSELTKGFSKDDKQKLYNIAEPKWIERKINEGTLLLHPKIRAELVSRNFNPLSIHKKMIWASVLVMYEGDDSIERFNRIKQKIISKHSNKWWFNVYQRVESTYIAKDRLKKQGLGSATSFAVQNSSFLGNTFNNVVDDILKTIPSE